MKGHCKCGTFLAVHHDRPAQADVGPERGTIEDSILQFTVVLIHSGKSAFFRERKPVDSRHVSTYYVDGRYSD